MSERVEGWEYDAGAEARKAALVAVFVLGLLCGGFIGWISWVWA